jgi:hypothetical protein
MVFGYVGLLKLVVYGIQRLEIARFTWENVNMDVRYRLAYGKHVT